MKHLLIAICIIIVSLGVEGQETDLTVPSHDLSIELGFNDNGLFALSYSKNFAKQENCYFSAHGSGGFGLYWSEDAWYGDVYPSSYLSVGPAINIGSDKIFLSVGAEYKRMETGPAYSGNGVGVTMGMTINTGSGFIFKVRTGITHWEDLPYDGPGLDLLPETLRYPRIGVSFGYGIGRIG